MKKRETPPPVTIDITLRVTLTAEDIDDIMCAALEGGITYWCYRAEVVNAFLGEYASEQISRGGTIKLYVDPDFLDEGEPRTYELTLKNFLYGVNRYVKEIYPGIVDQGKLDVGNIDAPAADAIIQYAIFDEIVYN